MYFFGGWRSLKIESNINRCHQRVPSFTSFTSDFEDIIDPAELYVYQISLAVIFTEITIDTFTRNIFGFFYKKIQILISKTLLGTYQLIGSPHVVQGSLFPSPRPTWFVAAWKFHTSWICLQTGFLLWVSLSTYSNSQKLDMIDMFVGYIGISQIFTTVSYKFK